MLSHRVLEGSVCWIVIQVGPFVRVIHEIVEFAVIYRIACRNFRGRRVGVEDEFGGLCSPHIGGGIVRMGACVMFGERTFSG